MFIIKDNLGLTDQIHSPDSNGNPFLLGFENLSLTNRDAKKIATASGIKLLIMILYNTFI